MSQQPFVPCSNSHLALPSNYPDCKMCQQPFVQCPNSPFLPFLAIPLTAKCLNSHLAPYSKFPDHQMSQQPFVPCPNSPFGSSYFLTAKCPNSHLSFCRDLLRPPKVSTAKWSNSNLSHQPPFVPASKCPNSHLSLAAIWKPPFASRQVLSRNFIPR